MEDNVNDDLELALQVCREVNAAVSGCLTSLDLGNKDLHGLLLVTKAFRANSLFVGACELAQRGLVGPTRVLIRTMLELQFVAEALVRNPAYIQDLIASDAHMRKRAFKGLLAMPAEQRIHEVTNAQLQAEHDAIEGARKPVTAADWAERAGRTLEYKLAYLLLSNEVHPSLRAAEAHLVLDEAGDVCALVGTPEVEELPYELLYAADCLITILLCIPAWIANSEAQQRLTMFRHDRRWIGISQRAMEAVERELQQQSSPPST